MPTGASYYIIIFLALVGVIGVKFGPQIVKILKPKPKKMKESEAQSQAPVEVQAQTQSVFSAAPTGIFQPKELLSPNEKKLYKTLDQALNNENLRIFAKVKLDGLFTSDDAFQSSLLSQLAVDFLAIDPEIMEPAFAIMIEESMFNETAGKELQAIREICTAGGLPVITIPAQPVYDPAQVRERIMQGFNRGK